jgi:site-specific recombinase XerD
MFEKEKGLKRQIRKYRLHIICELLYSTGLRISEAAALRVEDIDLIRGTVSVVEGKGGFNRTALLNDYCRIILSIYIQRIRPLTLTAWHDEALLFGTAGWERFGKFVNEGLKEYTEKRNLPPVRSHGFRHALGYHLLRGGCPIRSIQEILGHKKLANTEVYTKVDKEILKEVLDRFHPRQMGR